MHYPHGFKIDINSDIFPIGLDESIVRDISARRGEPEFLLKFRLKAYGIWCGLSHPEWSILDLEPIDFQKLSYYSAPKNNGDSTVMDSFERLGVPIDGSAVVDLVFDSVSVRTTAAERLEAEGVIFCSISEAACKYPEILKRYLGSVVPAEDNFYAALNSAVFSDGSFVYVPEGVRSTVDLSTYFRMNSKGVGQFERTLIVVERGGSVSYLEGCTASAYNENQLHAAVVELVAMEDSEISYATVQNWYPGDPVSGKGGVYNFVTKRGCCLGDRAKISWTQVETGAARTWKYPSCILVGDDAVGEFYSVALTSGKMQADTGSKMVMVGKRGRALVVSKGICSDSSSNCFRGLVSVGENAIGGRGFVQCDSMLVGDRCSAYTFPGIEVIGEMADVAHEASTSRLSEAQIIYLRSRGFPRDEGIAMVVRGFCGEVLRRLPFEFAAEAERLLEMKLDGTVG